MIGKSLHQNEAVYLGCIMFLCSIKSSIKGIKGCSKRVKKYIKRSFFFITNFSFLFQLKMEKRSSFEDSSSVMIDQSLTASTAIVNTTPEKSFISTGARSTNTMSSKKHISTKEGLMTIVKSSWVNVLLVFVPIGIASHFVWSPTITFIMNFLAIIPLAKLLGFATEDIALRTGEVKEKKTW
jgi:hypothetical protein